METSRRYTILLFIISLFCLILFLIHFRSFTDIGILRLDHSKAEIISQADSILKKIGYTENRDYPSITAIYNAQLVDTIGMLQDRIWNKTIALLRFSGEFIGQQFRNNLYQNNP
jgi:hypothetical protein